MNPVTKRLDLTLDSNDLARQVKWIAQQKVKGKEAQDAQAGICSLLYHLAGVFEEAEEPKSALQEQEESEVVIEIYTTATKIFERLTRAGLIRGNGHHMAEQARQEVEDRWIYSSVGRPLRNSFPGTYYSEIPLDGPDNPFGEEDE